MAITPTGAIFKTLNFDGESLRSYGVYISGEATFNAPAREVEMISIPGRSGQLALDKGRFENIEVTYPAGIYADTEADFAEAVSELRNFLCSRSGYCRIEDDYNPNEFRMGIYKSGLEITPALLKAGEFDLVFDCKPQRWLKSGEDEIEVQDGDTISNPTLFEASPLLEVDGYGTMEFNGYEIEIDNVTYGNITIAASETVTAKNTQINIVGVMMSGDSISLPSVTVSAKTQHSSYTRQSATITDSNPLAHTTGTNYTGGHWLETKLSNIGLVYGTPSTITNLATETASLKTTGGMVVSVTYTLTTTVDYDGDSSITITTSSTSTGGYFPPSVQTISHSDITANSTAHIIGLVIYIDTDLGEAYSIDGDNLISLNSNIDIGSDLPTLAPGANTITFDNTITELKVIPRWWKI